MHYLVVNQFMYKEGLISILRPIWVIYFYFFVPSLSLSSKVGREKVEGRNEVGKARWCTRFLDEGSDLWRTIFDRLDFNKTSIITTVYFHVASFFHYVFLLVVIFLWDITAKLLRISCIFGHCTIQLTLIFFPFLVIYKSIKCSYLFPFFQL